MEFRVMSKMIVKKPWGTYEVLLDAPTYKVKRIVVNPYERFSLQYHNHREEHWVIVEGYGQIHISGRDHTGNLGSHWVIRPKEIHRATAGVDGLIFIETQTGDCREEDIVRLQDDYGRLDSNEVSV